MNKTFLQKCMRMQANACFLDLIKFDKYACRYLRVLNVNYVDTVITVTPDTSYILPSHVVFILEWCREHGISALLISFNDYPAIKFETYV